MEHCPHVILTTPCGTQTPYFIPMYFLPPPVMQIPHNLFTWGDSTTWFIHMWPGQPHVLKIPRNLFTCGESTTWFTHMRPRQPHVFKIPHNIFTCGFSYLMWTQYPMIYSHMVLVTPCGATLCGYIPHVNIKPYVDLHMGFCVHGAAKSPCEKPHGFPCENTWGFHGVFS